MFNTQKIKSIFGHFLNDEDPSEILEELTPIKEVEKKPVLKKSNEDDFNLEEFLKETPRAQLLFDSLFSIKQKEYYYSRNLQKIEYVKSRTALVDLISQDFPEFIGISEKGARKGNRFFTLDSLFFSACFFNNTVETIIKKVDLFQKEKLIIEKIGSMLFIKKNSLDFIQPKPLDVTDDIYEEIIDDYLQHFKELSSLLEWIVACRFTNNRRQSYLHLKIPAGFGKSFFIGVLSSLGMIAKCRYDDFKSPSSLRPQEFENSLSMIIDEFTVFKKEFKDYTNSMILDPKYELRTEVELYSKIFLSAESSNSFTGGVDAQITDRMNVIDKSNSVKLEHRAKYQQYGNLLYFNCMKHYVYKTITDKVEYYKQQGELESSNQAELVLKSFYKKHKLKAENIVDSIKVNFYTKIYELFDADEYDLSNTDTKIKKNIITTNEYIHIKQVKSTFEDIIKCFGEDFYKKARYKVNNFEEMFHLENKNHKVDGKTIRCIRIDKANFINLFENYSDDLLDNIDLIEPPF